MITLSRMLVVTFNRLRGGIIKHYTPRSPYYFLFAPRIYGCYSERTSRSWWIAHSTQRQPRDATVFLFKSFCLRANSVMSTVRCECWTPARVLGL